MKESQAAAIWQGYVHGEGTARDDVELALPFSLVWAGKGIKTFTATGDLPGASRASPCSSRSGSAPTATGPTTRRTSSLGELKPEYARARGAAREGVRRRRSTSSGRARRWRSSTSSCATGSAYPAAVASDLPRHRRARARAAVSAPGRRRHVRGGHGARGRAGHLLGRRRRPARRGQLPRHRGRASRSSRPSRTGSCGAERRLDRRAERRVPRSAAASACTTRRCATASRRSASSSTRSRSSRSRGCSTSSASTGSRPGSRASRRTTGTRSKLDRRRRPARGGVGLLPGRAGRPRGARRARRAGVGDRVADLRPEAERDRRRPRHDARPDHERDALRGRATGSTPPSSASTRRARSRTSTTASTRPPSRRARARSSSSTRSASPRPRRWRSSSAGRVELGRAGRAGALPRPQRLRPRDRVRRRGRARRRATGCTGRSTAWASAPATRTSARWR